MENGQGIMGSSSHFGHKLMLAPIKVFTCKYCGRKFLNSRALGGHQNAHKKERTIWMTAMSSNRPSIGIQPHALIQNPGHSESTTSREDIRGSKRVGDPWTFKGETNRDLGWPGSFHACSSDSNVEKVTMGNSADKRMDEALYESDIHVGLDLELRL